jgi:hypothetical protein
MWKSTPVFADINGDGFLDLAAIARLGDGAHVWLGDGKGNWSDASEGLGVPFSCGGGVAVGDINNDGHADLAVADHCAGVFVYLGDGHGHWKASTQELSPAISRRSDLAENDEIAAQGSEDLALGDVNEDGFLDLVVASTHEAGLSVYLGDGSGKSWKEADSTGLPTAEHPEPGGSRPGRGEAGWANQVWLYDMNGDGYLDVVASYFSGPRVWLGDGKGHWRAGSEGLPKPRLGGLFRGITVGDVNEDGRMDILVANAINGPEVFLQNEAGSWQSTPDVLPSISGGARAVALGDLNRDGHLDMVVGGRPSKATSDNGLFILKGDGRGGWTELQNTGVFPTGLSTTWGITTGDVNKDGLLDFAVSTGGASKPKQDKNALPLMQVWVNQYGPKTNVTEKLAKQPEQHSKGVESAGQASGNRDL